MNITIQHPEGQSFEIITQTIADEQPIYRSPHVGNVNGKELTLIAGIANMGADMRVELVDTVRGDDSYGRPHEIVTATGSDRLCARRAAKSRIVSHCQVGEDVSQAIQDVLPMASAGRRVQDIHLTALRQVMPENVTLLPSSEFYPQLGNEALTLLAGIAPKFIDRPARFVSEEGKILPVADNDSEAAQEIYGLGDNPLVGKLLPLEAMMAAELLLAGINSNAASTSVVHVAGPHMIEYTKDPAIMEPTIGIAQQVAAELGVARCVTVAYVIPDMATLLADKRFPQDIATGITSQYDMLGIQL